MKKMIKNAIKVCVAAVFMLSASHGFAQNSKELTAVADGYVYISKKDDNYGGEDKMLVKRGGRIHNAFVKFDISGQGGTTVNKATLRIYCVDIEDASKETEIEVFRIDNDWVETKLTYANAPKPTKRLATVLVDKKGQYYEWDVTSHVKQQLSAGEKEVSFRLSDQKRVNNGIYFNTKEAASNKPLLVVE